MWHTLKTRAAAGLFAGAVLLAVSNPVAAVPFAGAGDFATFTFSSGNFTTSTAGMQLGDTWTLQQSNIGPVGGGNLEFESLDGSIPQFSPLTLTFNTGAVNSGVSFTIGFDRNGISDPVGAAGTETGTLTFTIADTVFATINPTQTLNSFQLGGTGTVSSTNAFYQDPQPFSFIASGTLGSNSTTASGSFSISSPPDPIFTEVPEPATLALLGTGLLGLVFLIRRSRRVADNNGENRGAAA